MKPLKKVLDEANRAFEEEMKENPSIYTESDRSPFVLGWMKTAYKQLYEEQKRKEL